MFNLRCCVRCYLIHRLEFGSLTVCASRRVGATVDEASHIPTVLMQKRGRPGTNESVHTKYENTNGSTTSRALQQSEDSLATDEKTTASRSRSVSYAKFDREILNNLKGEVKVRRTGRLKSVKTGGVLNSADYEEELALAELVGLPLTKRSLQEDENPSRSTEEEEATHDARNVDELDATKRNTTKEEKNERMYPYFQDTDTPKP